MEIAVTETDGLRLMHFGTRWCQGAMRPDAPDRLELEYAVRMNAWLLFHDLDRLSGMHLATLGLGAGSLTKFACRVLGMPTTAVEIDAAVIDICRAQFLLPPDGDRLRVVHADAAEYVANPCNAASVDVLQVDAYDAAVQRPALDTDTFYAHCRACLRDGGTLCVNLIGEGLDVRASVARIREQLQPPAVWQFPPTQAGNVVVIAHRAAPPGAAALTARADEIEQRWDLPARQWLAMARRSG